MQTLETQLISLLSELEILVTDLEPAVGFWITRHDEPIGDTEYATEAEAWAEIERLNVESTKDGRGYGVAPVSLCLTVGFTPATEGRDASWSYQTGDNSYSGGAYGHPHWAVVWLTADSVPAEVAGEIADELGSLINS